MAIIQIQVIILQPFFNQSDSDYLYQIISVYGELQSSYFIQARIEMGEEWIRNPAKLNFQPDPQGSSNEDQMHSRWLNFLKNWHNQLLSNFLLKNTYNIEYWQERKTLRDLEFDIIMKGVDKVEHDFLPKIQNLYEKKETYGRLKLREIFELQRSKHLEVDQSDPTLSGLPGTTLDEQFDFFVKRANDENLLKILDDIPKGKFDYSSIPLLDEN